MEIVACTTRGARLEPIGKELLLIQCFPDDSATPLFKNSGVLEITVELKLQDLLGAFSVRPAYDANTCRQTGGETGLDLPDKFQASREKFYELLVKK